jgi:Ca-activated chloride channel homolog
MKSIREFRDDVSVSRRGSILVLSAVFLVVILAFASFTIDFGYIILVNQEMQSAVDGAALAAAQELQLAPDGSEDRVIDAAVNLAALNKVNGQNLTLQRTNDVEIGIWDEATGQFTEYTGPDLSTANAVRIRGELSDARQNSVNLFFAPVLGHKTFQVADEAIAVIGRVKMRDVMLVIDCSRSMSSYNRMPMTRDAAQILIDELGEDDRLGLAVYSYPVLISNNSGDGHDSGNGSNSGRGGNGGGGAGGETRLSGRLENQLLKNFQPVRARIPQLEPALYASGTCIGGGMRVGVEELVAKKRTDANGNPVEQVIVLMTDGQANHTEPPGADPIDSIYYYADLAKQNDIVIHGITIGANAQSLAIEDAAAATGGQYHHVEDGDFDGLFEIYRGIGRGSDQPRLVR